jgi:hypothetical protein
MAKDHRQAGPRLHVGIDVEQAGKVAGRLRPEQRRPPAADGAARGEGEGGRVFADAGQQVVFIVSNDDGRRGKGHGYVRPKADGLRPLPEPIRGGFGRSAYGGYSGRAHGDGAREARSDVGDACDFLGHSRNK